MPSTNSWTRRTFIASLAALTTTPRLAALPFHTRRYTLAPDAILTLGHLGEVLATTPSPSPACFTLSPDHRHLYVANALTTFNHRPTGSVESYSIHPLTGLLTLLNRQPLALFSTAPTAIAVQNQVLRVDLGPAAHNLLPLNLDGSIARLTHSRRSITLVPSANASGSPHAPQQQT